MEDFLLSKILIFKVFREELGDDKGQCTAKTVGCFYPHSLIYIWKRSRRRSFTSSASLKASWYNTPEKHQRDSHGSWLCCYTILSLLFDKVGVKICYTPVSGVLCRINLCTSFLKVAKHYVHVEHVKEPIFKHNSDFTVSWDSQEIF